MKHDLTNDEKTLFSRVASHMVKGLSMDEAIQAVKDDDLRIACAFGCFRSGPLTEDQRELRGNFAAAVWNNVRASA